MDFDQASYYLRIGRLWASEPNERTFPNFSTTTQVGSDSTTQFQQDQRFYMNNKKDDSQNTNAIQQQITTPQTSTTSGRSDFSRELKRIRDARYKQLQRLMQTDEQKAAQRERKRQKYANESPEQKEIRRRRDCERRRLRWQLLPPDIRAQRRARASQKARERRLKMTPEQKDRKKNRDRENARKRRQRKKLESSQQNQQSQSSESNATTLNEVGGWLTQPNWINQVNAATLKVEPEDYSLVSGIRRF